jgi:hypothetical protein
MFVTQIRKPSERMAGRMADKEVAARQSDETL